MKSFNFDGKLFVKRPESKDEIYESIFYNMALKTRDLFTYKNLPDSIPSEYYEAYLQRFGFTSVFENENMLVTTFGGFGGQPNEYYIPTEFIVANPYMNRNGTLKDGKDCIIHKNTSLFSGTYQLNARYAQLLTEIEISMRVGAVNTRIPVVFNASDKDTKNSVESFYKDVEDGKRSMVMSDFLFDTLKAIPFGSTNSNYFTQYIELYQYVLSKWWAEYGVDSVGNMKREALSSNEISANSQTTRPLIYDMLYSRQKSWEKTNSLFGSSVTVELNKDIYELEVIDEDTKTDVGNESTDEDSTIREPSE